MQKRNAAIPAVYLILDRDGEILVTRRCNTGYEDGNYGLPSGHVEEGELPIAALIREAKEEIGITLEKEDLEFVHVAYRLPHDETGNRVDLFFRAVNWRGQVVNAEPHKCDDLKWATFENLPENTILDVWMALEYIQHGRFYSGHAAESKAPTSLER